jgi:hypothetical protein
MQQCVEIIKLYVAVFVVTKEKYQAVHEISDIYMCLVQNESNNPPLATNLQRQR